MPQDKDFKRVVRRRMAKTGETYTGARTALNPEPSPSQRRVSRWLEDLARPAQAIAAYRALKALPAERLRPAALSGLNHANWRVRRSCCRLLDDLSLTTESTAAIERSLGDGHPLVRRAALHTLSCKHCKPDGCTLDIHPLFDRMASDPSRRVRSAVLQPLSWAYVDEPWTRDLLDRFAEHDPSGQLRGLARRFLADLETRRHSDELRRQLPSELRAKTERHRGKWVAIADGRIVAVDDPRAIRHARRTYPDTMLYWVARRDDEETGGSAASPFLLGLARQ